uniref:Uncharacterized protein n=1 Tax=Oncorhynchus mykiss TaxID=8022 RepID=A0A8C7S5H3_ONCMY
MKMKALVRSLLLLNVACLLVRGQTQTETRYEDVITAASNQLLPLEVETEYSDSMKLNTEDVDQSEVSVRLSFPLQETLCSKAQGQQGQPCPLKKNYSHKKIKRNSLLAVSDVDIQYILSRKAMAVFALIHILPIFLLNGSQATGSPS